MLWKWLFEDDGDGGYQKVNYNYSFYLSVGFWNTIMIISDLTYWLLVAKFDKQIAFKASGYLLHIIYTPKE